MSLMDRITALADGTRTAKQIAAEVGCHPRTVYRMVNEGGGRLVSSLGAKKMLWANMLEMRRQGSTLREIAAALGVSQTYVHRLTVDYRSAAE